LIVVSNLYKIINPWKKNFLQHYQFNNIADSVLLNKSGFVYFSLLVWEITEYFFLLFHKCVRVIPENCFCNLSGLSIRVFHPIPWIGTNFCSSMLSINSASVAAIEWDRRVIYLLYYRCCLGTAVKKTQTQKARSFQ